MSNAPAPQRPGRPRGAPRPFDFHRQSTMSREHVRTLQIVQETMARGVTTTLASALRAVTHVAIRDIEPRAYDEYVREVPNPTSLTMLALRPLAGSAILQIPLSIGFVATELLLGGAGSPDQPNRPMTELELALLRNILELMLPEVRYAFEPIIGIQPAIIGQESNPQFAQLAAPTDMVVVISFDVRIEATTDVMTLCLPFSSLQPHLEAVSSSSAGSALSEETIAAGRARLRDHLATAEVEARATFRSSTLTSSQILGLHVGDVLMMNHPVEMPLTVDAGGVPLHDATIGRVNRHLGLEIVGTIPPDRYRTATRAQIIPADRA